MELKRRVWVEIDLARLRANYRRIAAAVRPARVLCVMKANAYGLGVEPSAAALATTDCAGFGVAEPFEALELKQAQLKTRAVKPVQILSSILPDEIGSEAWAIIPSKWESSSLANHKKWLLSVALQVSMIEVIFSAIRISLSHL